MTRFGYDDVNGIVIGDMYVTGTLHRYDTGVQQSPEFIGDTDADVRDQAKAWFAANNQSGDGRPMWPNGLELRIR